MSSNTAPARIGIYGCDGAALSSARGFGLWPPGYQAVLTNTGAHPVPLGTALTARSWGDVLDGLHGVVFCGSERTTARQAADEQEFCQWCKAHRLPLLAIDAGLHALNSTFGGSLYLDLPRELPEALQHRHPPERGLRHAVAVARGTHLARLYGEGEIIVNSEHRRAVRRVARGFCVSARALDGVIEAIESEAEGWFAIGVQWQPASATASGLDIQLFRGLVEACSRRLPRAAKGGRRVRERERVLC
jgi:putative glutamine amidotransferase